MLQIAGGILLALGFIVVVAVLALVNWRLMVAAAAVLFLLWAIAAPLAR